MMFLNWIGRIFLGLVRPVVDLGAWLLPWFASLHSVDEEGEVKRSWWLTLLLLPWLVLRSAWQVIVYLFAGLFGAEAEESHERRKRLLFGLPFVAMACLVVTGMVVSVALQTSVQKRYSRGLDAAVQNGNVPLAGKLSERLLHSASLRDPTALYSVSQFFGSTDARERSQALVELLAPIDAKGYPLAHRQRALETFQVLERSIDPVLMDQLFWHLSHSDGDNNDQMLMIWVEYYLHIGDLNRAIQKLERLALHDPQHWFAVAELSIEQTDIDHAIRALTSAAEAYSGQLAQNPLSKETRIRYASAMARLGKLEPSLQSMEFGWQLSNDADFARGISTLHVLQCDRALRSQPKDPSAPWNHLLQALRWNAENPDAYDRMVALYRTTPDLTFRARLLERLRQITVEHPRYFKSYFAWSAIELEEGRVERAIPLLERAIALQPESHASLNNLAWLLQQQAVSRGDQAMLLKAETLARRAVDLQPDSGSYRDTLGTILLEQGSVQSAVSELERALANVQNPNPIHEKLGVAYRKLGKPEIAVGHERMATKSQSSGSVK